MVNFKTDTMEELFWEFSRGKVWLIKHVQSSSNLDSTRKASTKEEVFHLPACLGTTMFTCKSQLYYLSKAIVLPNSYLRCPQQDESTFSISQYDDYRLSTYVLRDTTYHSTFISCGSSGNILFFTNRYTRELNWQSLLVSVLESSHTVDGSWRKNQQAIPQQGCWQN